MSLPPFVSVYSNPTAEIYSCFCRVLTPFGLYGAAPSDLIGSHFPELATLFQAKICLRPSVGLKMWSFPATLKVHYSLKCANSVDAAFRLQETESNFKLYSKHSCTVFARDLSDV